MSISGRWARHSLSTAIAAISVAGCTSSNPDIPVGDAAYALVPPLAANSGPQATQYRIGPLDQLSVTVFQEPDLSAQQVVVDSSGNLSLPLVGTVKAAGLSVSELSDAISAKLEPYLVKPQVTAAVTQAVAPHVTVDGSVEQPGVFIIQGRTTLIDALAMARGPSRVAALDQVVVFRQIDGRLAAARFNLKEIRLGLQPNPEIVGNDTVVVGFSNLKGVYRDLILSSALVSSFSYVLTR